MWALQTVHNTTAQNSISRQGHVEKVNDFLQTKTLKLVLHAGNLRICAVSPSLSGIRHS